MTLCEPLISKHPKSIRSHFGHFWHVTFSLFSQAYIIWNSRKFLVSQWFHVNQHPSFLCWIRLGKQLKSYISKAFEIYKIIYGWHMTFNQFLLNVLKSRRFIRSPKSIGYPIPESSMISRWFHSNQYSELWCCIRFGKRIKNLHFKASKIWSFAALAEIFPRVKNASVFSIWKRGSEKFFHKLKYKCFPTSQKYKCFPAINTSEIR